MIFQFIQPSLQLREFVREHLLFHVKVSSGTVLPSKPYHAHAEEGITFYIKGFLLCSQRDGSPEKRAQSVIFGPSIARQNLQLSEEYLMFFVRLQPGMLHRLLGLPMSELVQKNIDAEAVIGNEIRQLHDQLAYATSYESILKLVEDFLWKKFQKLSTNPHPSFLIPKLILQSPDTFNLDKMASLACLSNRQFERTFLRHVGVTPKLFARLCRFSQANELKERHPNKDWFSIAIETGYNDYQHLVKDFKAFDGGTPNTLLAENVKSPERWLKLALRSDKTQ
jgi:AraC-like DNA-binding protein